jgi:cysteine desulfurase
MAHSSIRFGIGRFTTEKEIDFAIDLLEKHVHRLVMIEYALLSEDDDIGAVE